MRVVGSSGIVMDLPDSLARGLIRSGAVELVADSAPAADQAPPPEIPAKPVAPPVSGKGSGVEAWRQYAAAVSGEPVEVFAERTRDDLIAEYGPAQ